MQNRLLPIAGVLVFVSAAIHLALGITGLAEAFSGGGSASLPALYLLGGLAALVLLAVLALTPVATTAATVTITPARAIATTRGTETIGMDTATTTVTTGMNTAPVTRTTERRLSSWITSERTPTHWPRKGRKREPPLCSWPSPSSIADRFRTVRERTSRDTVDRDRRTPWPRRPAVSTSFRS